MSIGNGNSGSAVMDIGEEQISPERITELADQLADKVHNAIEEIDEINEQTHMLSLNARIEAARAGGTTGAAFGVVASAIDELSKRSSQISVTMAQETREAISELQRANQLWGTSVRGLRLSDLALTNIELIDRNLYERSCDVRWWATDSSAVSALKEKTTPTYEFCSHRFGAILNSYTVYFDLVLCDMNGIVVANGRPDLYKSQGANCANSIWFQAANRTRSGEEFGFESVHRSHLVNNNRVLIYSCCVRTGGEVDGSPLGVLGIIFNWDALAQTIVEATPIPTSEKERSRVCIADDSGVILADTELRGSAYIDMSSIRDLYSQSKGFCQAELDGFDCCVAHAKAPGYETYSTGWHSLIIQRAV